MSYHDWPTDWPSGARRELDRLEAENKRLREAVHHLLLWPEATRMLAETPVDMSTPLTRLRDVYAHGEDQTP